MARSALEDRIIQEIDRLPSELQQQVLDFVTSLAASPSRGVSGREMLRFAGILPREDADEMLRAIEGGYGS